MGRILAAVHRGEHLRIVALAPFEIHFPHFGGAQRIHELLTRIDNEVIVLAPNASGHDSVKLKNLDIRYKPIPDSLKASPEFDTDLAKIAKDLWAQDLQDLDPDVVILEHPWQVDAITGQKFLYDSHNNETHLKQQIHPQVAEATAPLEARALKADLVTYCSDSDNIQTDSPKVLIPNGTHLPELAKHVPTKNLLFAGSAHTPNVAAAIMLARLAPALPDYQIIIAGTCGMGIENLPPNVRVLGFVNDQTLDFLFRNAHAFVNLITAGSGTSLKVARALSYGLPVISSKLGARGYENACIVAETAQGVLEALTLLSDPITHTEAREAAREAATALSWDSIGAKFNEAVMSVA